MENGSTDNITSESFPIRSLLEKLHERFVISSVDAVRGNQAFVMVGPTDAVPLITYLKTTEGFTHLSYLTAVDYPEREVFELHYMLHAYPKPADESGTARVEGSEWGPADIAVVAEIPRSNFVVDSIHTLWAAAATYQRELYEMYGIEFDGSPGMTDPFILEGWDDIPPMRREFDTKKYSEETFFPRPGRATKDPTRHMADTLYPEVTE